MWNVFLSQKQILTSYRNVLLLEQRTKRICFLRKTINCSAKYIRFNEIKNKIFIDALSKSDARCDGKQEFFLYSLSQTVAKEL